MLADFIPEALALGAAFAAGKGTGVLLALQNLPEGFNAYEELVQTSKFSPNKIISAFACLVVAGPVSTLIGYHILSQAHELMAGLMLFARAGILYLVFQDIAPESKVSLSGIPALGAVAGFIGQHADQCWCRIKLT